MKSIIYILIIVFISSILISAFPKTDSVLKQTFSLQCVNDDHTSGMLNKSADIISSRLSDYGVTDADVFVNEKESCINMSIDNQVSLSDARALLTSKGKLEFYETYDRLEFIKNPGIDKDLASILNIPVDGKEFDRFSGILGYCKGKGKSKVELYLKNHYLSKPGQGINFFWSEQPDDNGDFYLFLLQNKASLDGSYISESTVKGNLSGRNPELLITFDKSGELVWQNITKRNIGKSIAIVLDKKVLQAPIVRSEIKEGKCIITGNFSQEEIRRINSLINNDELPLEFNLMN